MRRMLVAVAGAWVWVAASTGWAQAPVGQPGVPTTLPVGAPPVPADAVPADAGQVEPPEPEGERPLAEDEAMVLNFERADIREVIHSLATALGLSYTIDPRIEGQVTIRTTGKIARDDLFPLFNEILRNNGIAAVKQGDLYQMLPVAEAKTRAIIPTGTARAGVRAEDGFVIEIVSLRHVSAEEMANILQPFVTPGGDVLAYPRANTIVVTDIDSNVRRLRELVATFDIDGFTNLHARVFKVKEGDPDELVNELLELLAPYGVTATGEGEGGVSLVSLSRLDAIVAFAIDRSAFDKIAYWLSILDVPPDQTSGRQTFVYAVENAKAADLAAVLNELFGGDTGTGGGGGIGRNPRGQPGGVGLFGAGGVSGGGGVGGARGTGRSGRRGATGGGVGGVGGATAGQAAGAFGGGGGTAGTGGRRRSGLTGAAGTTGGAVPGAPGAAGQAGGGQVLGVSLPGGVQPGAPGGPGQGPSGPPPIFKEEVRIVADEVTNSLVILATKRDYQLILDVLKRIDVVPRQVVLEVMIAEVLLGNDLRFGIQYAIAEGKLRETATTSNDIFHNTPPTPTFGGFLGNAARVPDPVRAFAVISDRENFQIFINALQNLTDVKMLSAPHVIAADNREAHILVSDSIPILTQTQTSTGITGVTGAAIAQVQYRDVGKILTILPQVNSKGLVNLQVRQEVSQLTDESFGETGSPSFSTREAETTVVVNDGETVLIGGIIDDSIRHDRAGVPFMMSIPVLGRFFRDESDSISRTELLITITPYVIRGRDEARGVTDEFTDRLHGLSNARRALDARRRRTIDRVHSSGEETPTGP